MSKALRSMWLVFLILLGGIAQAQEKELLIYCGITMVRPITELARRFEQNEKVRVTISQGGSEDLYQSAKKSRLGDLYFPGEPSYRARHQAEGLLGDYQLIGYNQIAIFVPKGNPLKVRPDLRELLRKDVTLVLGNAESGSVGLESKRALDAVNLYPKAISKAALLMPDSRAINLALRRGDGDIALNWRATAFFPDTVEQVEALPIDPKIAPPQPLLLIELTFSKNPSLARKFVDYVAGNDGQAVFRKYGFMDKQMRY